MGGALKYDPFSHGAGGRRARKRGGAGEKGEDGKFPFQEQIKNAPFPGALRRAGEPCQHVVLPPSCSGHMSLDRSWSFSVFSITLPLSGLKLSAFAPPCQCSQTSKIRRRNRDNQPLGERGVSARPDAKSEVCCIRRLLSSSFEARVKGYVHRLPAFH